MLLISSCSNTTNSKQLTYRFDQDLFELNSLDNINGIDSLKVKYPQFFSLFCSDIIGIGPDTSGDLPEYLNQFLTDQVIIRVHEITDSVYRDFQDISESIHKGIDRFNKSLSINDTVKLIGYISGFNQSFVSLPGILGIGLDNYLGGDIRYYQQLAIPIYLRQKMDPEYLAVDAVRAWIMSETPQTPEMKTLLDNMITEGKILYLLHESMPKTEKHKIFRYKKEQLEWCLENEKPMWEFLLENELLYSTDRLLISRFTKDAPFIREFGQESPGRAGSWLGFKIVQSYMKRTGTEASDLINTKDAIAIFSESRYRPG